MGLILGLSMCRFSAAQSSRPSNFLFASGNLRKIAPLLQRPDIQGVQVVISWRSLEPKKDHYNFSQIAKDLKLIDAARKKLFVQVQDHFFRPRNPGIPAYILHNPIYHGGITRQSDHPGEGKAPGSGWVADQWNPKVRQRFQRLLFALAKKFDGKIHGINLPESSIDINIRRHPAGFTCDEYFQAELDNMKAAKEAFTRSYVVQYVNFWPCEWNNDRNYMSRVFAFAQRHGIGLGGPDVIPYWPGQMKNSYPFFHRYKNKLVLIAMAVQGATLTYRNPKTGQPFTEDEFRKFARDYLGANIIFWSISSPWLHNPR